MSEYRAVCPVCGKQHDTTACPTSAGIELGKKASEAMAVPVANAINKLLEDKDSQIDALRSENERLREAYVQGAEYVNAFVSEISAQDFNRIVSTEKINGIRAWLEESPDLPQPPEVKE